MADNSDSTLEWTSPSLSDTLGIGVSGFGVLQTIGSYFFPSSSTPNQSLSDQVDQKINNLGTTIANSGTQVANSLEDAVSSALPSKTTIVEGAIFIVIVLVLVLLLLGKLEAL